MSESLNPYQSPEAPIEPEGIKNGVLTGQMLGYLKESSPWLRFIGIIGYISFGIICLTAVISFFAVIAAGGIDIPGLGFLSGVMGVVVLLVYGLTAVIIFFPAHFTFKFGAYLNAYFNSYAANDLETAFKNNKSLWLFYGILMIIYLAVIALSIIIGIISIFTIL